MKFIYSFALVLSSGLLFANVEHGDIYTPTAHTIDSKDFSFEILGKSISSKGLYDSGGNTVKFTGQQDYYRFDTEFNFKYGLNKRLELQGLSRYRKNVSTESSGLETSRTGIESLGVGGKYRVWGDDQTALAAFAQGRYYLKSTTASVDTADIDLSEEGNFLSSGLALSHSFSKEWTGNAKFAYEYPGDEQSQHTLYDFSFYWQRDNAAIGAGVRGTISASSAETTKNLSNTGTTQTLNSLDPEYQEIYGELHLSLHKKWKATLSGGFTTSGSNWDQTQFVGLGVTFVNRNKSSYQKVAELFKEYDFEASISKISPRKRFVKIDKGLTDDIEKGMDIDIYDYNYLGGNKLIATGRVHEVSVKSSIIKIEKIYDKKLPMKLGHIVRGLKK